MKRSRMWQRKAAVLRSAGVVLLSALSSVMSLLCVLLDSAEEDGYRRRFVCFLSNTRSHADRGLKLAFSSMPKNTAYLTETFTGVEFYSGKGLRYSFLSI